MTCVWVCVDEKKLLQFCGNECVNVRKVVNITVTTLIQWWVYRAHIHTHTGRLVTGVCLYGNFVPTNHVCAMFIVRNLLCALVCAVCERQTVFSCYSNAIYVCMCCCVWCVVSCCRRCCLTILDSVFRSLSSLVHRSEVIQMHMCSTISRPKPTNTWAVIRHSASSSPSWSLSSSRERKA